MFEPKHSVIKSGRLTNEKRRVSFKEIFLQNDRKITKDLYEISPARPMALRRETSPSLSPVRNFCDAHGVTLTVRFRTTLVGGNSIFTMSMRTGGKSPDFAVYLNSDWFDTPENRVITSGLTLASLIGAFWVFQPVNAEQLKPRK